MDPSKVFGGIMFPLPSIENVKWGTEIGELEELALNAEGKPILRMINVGDIPIEFRELPLSRIIYLAGEVSALVSRQYLESYEPSTTILTISQTDNRSQFCPVPPDYFRQV